MTEGYIRIQHKGDIPRHELHECPPGFYILVPELLRFMYIVPVLIYTN